MLLVPLAPQLFMALPTGAGVSLFHLCMALTVLSASCLFFSLRSEGAVLVLAEFSRRHTEAGAMGR